MSNAIASEIEKCGKIQPQKDILASYVVSSRVLVETVSQEPRPPYTLNKTSSILFKTHVDIYLIIVFNNNSTRARVGYEMVDDSQRGAELAVTISTPASGSGIIVYLKTPKEIPQNTKKTRTPNSLDLLVLSGII